MKDDVAIKVQNISKRYRIGSIEQKHDTLVGKTISLLKSPFKNYLNIRKLTAFKNNLDSDILWALKDINFEIKRGEILGLIGGNGAGKSTLLKILSKIVYPTSGNISTSGKIGSLLEVGTGFHPDLTGRENVYLNGTLLGMSKKDVDYKFESIVDFSGIEKHIDTPVKRYSSGMKVRLAFAVAAHLEPEILLIDEVLAVGDADFQKKCLGKMDEISKQGRTIIFVSHSMPAILRLCTRVILLEKGKLISDGKPNDIVLRYLNKDNKVSFKKFWNNSKFQPGNEFVKLCSVEAITLGNEDTTGGFDITKKIGIQITYKIISEKYVITPNISVFNDRYDLIFNAIDTQKRDRVKVGNYKSIAWIPGNFLSEGKIYIDVLLISMSHKISIRHIQEEKIISIDVVDYGNSGSAKGDFTGEWGGFVRPLLNWDNHFSSLTNDLDSKD